MPLLPPITTGAPHINNKVTSLIIISLIELLFQFYSNEKTSADYRIPNGILFELEYCAFFSW